MLLWVISLGYTLYRSIMILRWLDIQDRHRHLTFWTYNIIGRICADRYQYVWNFHSYQRSWTSRHATCGVLLHARVPENLWEHSLRDDIVRLCGCVGFDAIRVVVDRLSMMRYCIPCHTAPDEVGWRKLFRLDVGRLHRPTLEDCWRARTPGCLELLGTAF